jgi:hypothetical protein
MDLQFPPTPGIYPGSSLATLLRENQQAYMFQQQLIAAGASSIAFQLNRTRGAAYPFGCSFQIWFTNSSGAAANPGAFEIDVQDSDLDVDAQYCVLSSLTGGLNASFVGRIELPTFWGKFVRVNVKTLTNAVYTSVLVTR